MTLGTRRVLSPIDVGLRFLDPAGNAWGDLDAVWTRSSAGGAWVGRGPWRLGAPLPEAQPVPSVPPGWLAAGLPQGRGVLVGRLAESSWRGPEGAGVAWIRQVGFE